MREMYHGVNWAFIFTGNVCIVESLFCGKSKLTSAGLTANCLLLSWWLLCCDHCVRRLKTQTTPILTKRSLRTLMLYSKYTLEKHCSVSWSFSNQAAYAQMQVIRHPKWMICLYDCIAAITIFTITCRFSSCGTQNIWTQMIFKISPEVTRR